MQVGWSVRHHPSSYGSQQCSALPTHSSLRPHQRGLETLSKGFKFGEITLFNCFIFFYISSGNAALSCSSCTAFPLQGATFSCLPFSMARLCSLSLHLCQGFSSVLISNHGQIVCHGVLSIEGQIALHFALCLSLFFPISNVVLF